MKFALPVVLVASLLCHFSPTAQADTPTARVLQSRTRAIRIQFEESVTAFADAEYSLAQRLFRDLLDREDLDQSDQPIMHYMIGRCLYGQGQYVDVIRQFHEFRSRYTQHKYESASYLWTGHADFQLGDNLEAARWYMRAQQVGSDAHRDIAAANLRPLLVRGLSSGDLEYLLDDLGSGRWSVQSRMLIAARWEADGRRADALELYQQAASASVGTPLSEDAQDRVRVLAEMLEREITIGILAPLSGDYQAFGAEVKTAAHLAMAHLQSDIRLVIKDTRGDPLGAAWAADSLINSGCDVVIGPLLTATIAATVATFRAHEIVQILPVSRRASGMLTGLSPYLYTMSIPADHQAAHLASVAWDSQFRRFAAMIADTPEGHAAGSAFARTVLAAGGTIYPIQYFPAAASDFAPWLRRLKEVVRNDRDELLPDVDSEEDRALEVEARWRAPVDGFLIWGDAEDIPRVAAQVRAFGFEGRFLGNASWGNVTADGPLSDLLDSAMFVSDEWIDTQRSDWRTFTEAYQKLSRRKPGWLAGRVYDAVHWIDQSRNESSNGRLSTQFPGAETYIGISGSYGRTTTRQPDSVSVYRFEFGRPVLARE